MWVISMDYDLTRSVSNEIFLTQKNKKDKPSKDLLSMFSER